MFLSLEHYQRRSMVRSTVLALRDAWTRHCLNRSSASPWLTGIVVNLVGSGRWPFDSGRYATGLPENRSTGWSDTGESVAGFGRSHRAADGQIGQLCVDGCDRQVYQHPLAHIGLIETQRPILPARSFFFWAIASLPNCANRQPRNSADQFFVRSLIHCLIFASSKQRTPLLPARPNADRQ